MMASGFMFLHLSSCSYRTQIMNVKKYIIPALLVLVYIFIGYANYIYPLIHAPEKSGDFSNPTFKYYLLVLSYILILLTLLIEKDNLEVFNIDKFSIAMLPLLGIIRVKLHIPYEEYYRAVCNLFGLILFVYCLMNWRKLPKTKPNWILLGVLSSIIVFLLAFPESIQIEKYAHSNNMYAINPIIYGVRNFFFTITFVAPFEEIITRGIFWGQLRKWNIGENKIFWIQAVVFWLLHGWQIFTPISFFITLPIITIIYSLLVRNSKQLFPSIVSHTLINTLGPIIVYIISGK